MSDDELDLALGALAIVFQWQPDYEPPPAVVQGTAIGRLVRAAGDQLLPYLMPGGAERLDALTDEERSQVDAQLRQLATEHPEDLEILENNER